MIMKFLGAVTKMRMTTQRVTAQSRMTTKSSPSFFQATTSSPLPPDTYKVLPACRPGPRAARARGPDQT